METLSCPLLIWHLIKLNIIEKRNKQKPWITKSIITKINHRNDLFRKKKNDPNNQHLKSSYNKFRNSVIRDIKKSKKEYYLTYFDKCKNNMKKTWKGINELIRPSNKFSTVNQIMHNKTLINESKQIAETFNNFFANVGPEVDKSIPKTPISPLSFLNNRVAKNFLFKPTCNSELMTIILSLKWK